LYFFTRKNIIKNPVNSYGPKERKKRIKNHIDIVISKTKNVNNGKKFNEQVTLEIVPPGRVGSKKSAVFIFISAFKQIDKKSNRISEQPFILFHAKIMKTPGIEHIGKLPVINSDPAIEYPRHHFQQIKNDQLRIIQTGFSKKSETGNQPGKK
jgi:hypothetical protein